MATQTTNISLLKPELQDNFNLKLHLNDNWDKIDNSINSKADKSDTYTKDEICTLNKSSKNILTIADGTYTNKNLTNCIVTVKDNKIKIKSDGKLTVSGGIKIPATLNITEETQVTMSTQNAVNNGSVTDTNPLLSLYSGANKLTDITISKIGNTMSKSFTVTATNITINLSLVKYKTYDIESDIQIENGNISTAFVSPMGVRTLAIPLSENSVGKKNLSPELQGIVVIYNTLYVTTDTTKIDNIKTFGSILAANNSIKDNNEKNRYIIKVADGEYHDLETTYAGSTDTAQLQGIVAKDYVYYESESDNPTKCMLIWDGAVGFNDLSLLTNAVALKKCIFHITGGDYTERGLHTHIKGFTLRSVNTRYGLHCESGGYGRNVDWLVDNCIIEFGGRPQVGEGTSTMPVVGMGVSPHQIGKFKDCSFKFISLASGNTINCHDNTETSAYRTTKAVKTGCKLFFVDCNFNSGKLNFVETQNSVTSDTPYVAQINNSVGIDTITHSENWKIIDNSTSSALIEN